MRKVLICLFCSLFCTGCNPQMEAEAVPEPEPENGSETSSVTVSVRKLPAEEAPITESGDPLSESEAEAQPEAGALSGKRICIDPGHCVTNEKQREQVSPKSSETKNVFGGGTSGRNQTEEKLNLTVGLLLRDALEAEGAEVIMTREVSEIAINNIERAQIGNSADCCIRIHADGVDDSSVHGVSVLVPSGELLGTPEIIASSAELGQLMVDCVAAQTGAKNRGVVKRSDLVGFNWSEVPVVLIEMGFMTNPEEDTKLETAEYQQKIVQGIVESLKAWYA